MPAQRHRRDLNTGRLHQMQPLFLWALDLAPEGQYTSPNNTRHASACKRTPAGFLLPMKFDKPAIDGDAQLALLRSRGLQISDEAGARHHLRFIGYYRFSGYSLPFQRNYNADGTHQFLPGASFEQVLDLYTFDRKLRILALDALERIEVAFRSVLSQSMSEQHGPHWYTSPELFVPSYQHDKFIDLLKKDIGDDPARAGMRQTFIQHYYQKYDDPPLPPSWMVFEVLSLGTVSQVFKNLLRSAQKPVARVFGLDGTVLSSWIHAISYLRNLAAHHQRLWNRSFTIKPVIAKQYAGDLADPGRFYAQAVMIEVLLKVVAPDTRWGQRLAALLAQHPSVRADRMGFAADWDERPVWRDS